MEKISTLSIDIETYSDVDLIKHGVYKYSESENFEILLFGYSINGGDVQVVDLACGEVIPVPVLQAFTDPDVKKWAFNAMFERVCLSAYLRKNYPEFFCSYSIPEDTVRDYLDPEGWHCTMIWCAYMGLPMSLESAGAAIGLKEQKMTEGKDLIKYFSIPCRPTKANGGRTRNLPKHAPDKWATFISYNRRDVEVEMSIQEKLSRYPVPDFLWDEYHLDQEINDRGILVDMELVKNAIEIDQKCHDRLDSELKKLTGLENPNSVAQLKEWLSGKGISVDSLGKKQVASLLQTADGEVRRVLELRQQSSKSSVRKYAAMANMACADNRARGMFRFYKANRTGRFASAGIQLQNMPQNHMPDLEHARALVRNGDYDSLEVLYDNIPNVLSELIRTAFIPKAGMKFIVSDFSAVEARCLGYLAGEAWRMKAFAEGKDIYCESASQMFGVPVVKHGINGDLRQKGKIAELALGYGGSVGALKAMGALEIGLKEEELQPLVDSWRSANPNIILFWWDVDRAVKTVIKTKIPQTVRGIGFRYKGKMLFIDLPSGRHLTYVKPEIGENRFGSESVTYLGIGPTKKWERIESYGPKFVENITQAICRDILCYALKTLRSCFIVAHVHDEIIIECNREVSLDAVCKQMGRTPDWIPGLLLRADGYETDFYKKD